MDYENTNQPTVQQEQVMSLGEWMITLLIMAIPLVGLIMACVWGFGSNTPKTKANFCRAILIYYVISIVLAVLFGSAITAALIAAYPTI